MAQMRVKAAAMASALAQGQMVGEAFSAGELVGVCRMRWRMVLLGSGQVTGPGSSCTHAIIDRLAAAIRHAWSMANWRDGGRPSPVSLAQHIRPSTRACAR
jgi:hypothetical protein